MNLKRRRTAVPHLSELEGRTLLAVQGPIGVWLGQDGHDLVGQGTLPAPNDIQDMHFAVSGLPAGRTVVTADVFGHGGGHWTYQGAWGPAAEAWVQTQGATTADVFLDPYMIETGREFNFSVTFDDGSSAAFNVQGGAANPNLRMPSAAVSAVWTGQDGRDLTGSGPNVGPDGIPDAVVSLAGLSGGIDIASVNVTTASGLAWSFGTNPGKFWNAELVRNGNDPTKAELFLNPVAGLQGQTLKLVINYANGKTDTTTINAGPSDPALRTASPSPVPFTWSSISASWLGQDGLNLTGPGDVHVSLSGLPAGRTVVSAVLSDPARTSWGYRAAVGAIDPGAYPLGFSRTDATRAEIAFPPVRDETGTTLTLRLTLDDGTAIGARFAGGSADLSRRAPAVAPTSITAQPGDNLALLVTQYGSIHLSAGTYSLTRPLMLVNPVAITADPGATLLFQQGPADPAWTTAINIQAGNTTLDGFAVRFAGPIRWTTGVNSGPSVIGNSNALGGPMGSALVNITLSHLDLRSPPASSAWEEAPRMIWLANAQSGKITDNTLQGGVVEFNNGPWQVTGNRSLGTVAKTFAYSVFATHFTHDVVLANNSVEPVDPAGKTWRFLVLTGSGYKDQIRDNTVVGVGPMDDDTVANPNAPELILTESYRLQYEGAPAAIEAGGWILQIPTPQGGPARAGDVVSILSGPEAGQWRVIAQVLSPTAYLLDAPITSAATAISIATGFVNDAFENNLIDARGSSSADGFVLAGNHFGTRVSGNHVIGGRYGFRISAAPTEQPVIWGWSHAPFLGGTIQGNLLEDTLRGGLLSVEHSAFIKSESGRTYMTVALLKNTVAWSGAFLAAHAQGGQPGTFTIGDLTTANPAGLWLSAAGNVVRAPSGAGAATWYVSAATVNGQPTINQLLPLSPLVVLGASTGLGLVADSGSSGSDGVTNDAHIRFDPVESAVGYEYSLSGVEGTYQSIGPDTAFEPSGLVQGSNTVYVRAIDDQGVRGPVATFSFVYDTVAPGAVTALTAFRDGRVQFHGTGPGDVYEYRLGGSATFVPIGPNTFFTDPNLVKGTRTVQVHAIDPAGNIGTSAMTNLVPSWMAVVVAPSAAPKVTPAAPAPALPKPKLPAPQPVVRPVPSAPTFIGFPTWGVIHGRAFARKPSARLSAQSVRAAAVRAHQAQLRAASRWVLAAMRRDKIK